ncbi:MAG: ABC transporter substrate-binding protein [Gemmatimonadetes bacterium]|nr:ABC transporter substrate-binding protein [Gemmatimonadota bacterium]
MLPVLLLAVLVGCGRAEPASGAAEPAAVQELVVGVGQDEFMLAAYRERLGIHPLNAGICEPLVRLTHDFRPEPLLATRWEYIGDNTFRFTLRRDVRFHDGKPLNAAAVKQALDRVAQTVRHSYLNEESVLIVNDSTVDIRPARPNLRLVEQLVHPHYSIYAPGTDPSDHPVCTGPFRFHEYIRDDRFTVLRNPEYWGEPARLERLTFRFIPDENTRALALRSGEVDVTFDVNRSMVAALGAARGIQVVAAPPGGVILMYINLQGSPPHDLLGDPTLRRAVALAVDRRALVERILEGHAQRVHTVNPPAVLGEYASMIEGIPYDPDEARRLLDAAGWEVGRGGMRSRNGRPLSLLLIPQPRSIDAALAQYVQANLAQVGIQVRIEPLDPGAFTSRLNSGQFDLDIELPNQNDANPAFLLSLRWYPPANIRNAVFMAPGPHYDALVERALAAPDHDEARRRAAEAMRLLLDEEVAAIPLAGIYRIYALKERVRGFNPHPSRANQEWTSIWIAR